ncbi:arylsulfatase [Croceicoccus sp. F390]|uniref:Arylsulfatase n=1 Tax=Croceicoccus esteveae TaxID=3075597 RepID=A0ABU2ZKY4_9SPHN|nr:arylsulfatase [Croceicoccus sp. F390]MDT0577050.1 arylsulfatase [Croceicoccus sp. F390]
MKQGKFFSGWLKRPAILIAGGASLLSSMVWAQDPAAETGSAALPKGAPNIVVILLDDVGFGSAGTFGGLAPTPNLDALAADGLSYTNFHTAGICSPTRASLLTGRNPHRTGIGAVMNSADDRPGYSGIIKDSTASIAAILKQYGYATAAFGKWHQTPDHELSQAGPFDRWPSGRGFEHFYGFQGGETDQFHPTLYRGTEPVDASLTHDYHFTNDMTAQSVAWFRNQRTMQPDRPFFLYYATGAVHAPIQVPQSYTDAFAGQFDEGWDVLRERIFARQKELGLFPADAELPTRPAEIPAWDSLSVEERTFAARLMEAYAGFVTHTDAQIGQLIEALKQSGEYENTIIFFVGGDNGASLEGGIEGSLNYLAGLIGLPEPDAGRLARIGDIGGPDAHTHVNTGWAWANNAPYQWGKAMPAWLGAIRNPLVVTWPARMADEARGTRRDQFGHVNDIAPTILDVLNLSLPDSIDGVAQQPFDGTSLLYSFADADAEERHDTQYFEVFGSRAIYHDGWFAAADHGRLPWTPPSPTPTSLEDDIWRLYNLDKDPTQTNDLAAQRPDKLAEMQALFMQQAAANDVLPLRGQVVVNRGIETIAGDRTTMTYGPATRGVPENGPPAMSNRSWQIDADLHSDGNATGVLGAVGGVSAGWSLWIDAAGHPNFTYALFDLQTLTLRSDQALAAGDRNVSVQFDYDGPGYAKGGKLTLLVDGVAAASGTLLATTPGLFTIDETFDVGLDRGSPVADYPVFNPFTGGHIEGFRITLIE